jgi:hypothetical protein
MKHNDTSSVDPLNGTKISDILQTLPDQFTTTTISLGALNEALSGRSYGILLLVLALPNLIPIPAPGLSAIVGAPLILVTFQMMIGLETPWFPNFIAKRTLKTEQVRRIFTRIIPVVRKMEHITKPRLKFLVKPPIDRLIDMICVVLSLMIMMPIPFGNALPALAICFFAIGILQRDGVFSIAGLLIIAFSAAAISTFLGSVFQWIL